MPTYNKQGKLLKSKNVNFFTRVNVSSTNFADNKISWDFISQGLALMVQSHNPADVIEYSFDGETVHGDLSPTFPSASIIFDERRHCVIWFRRATAGEAVLVRFEAWRNSY